MNEKQAKKILDRLFPKIGWKEAYLDQLSEECAKACLHALADSAYEKKLFSLADYQRAKEAIAAMEDNFSREFRERFGENPPPHNHLF